MSSEHLIAEAKLTLDGIQDILAGNKRLALTENVKAQIIKSQEYLEFKAANSDHPIYGINTGFGALYDKRIESHEHHQLQVNLVTSHASGVGPAVPSEIVRIMLLLKIQALAYGYSGVQLSTVRRLMDFFTHDISPIVYEMGSLGASGDLTPLAHLALPLLGLGEVAYQGEQVTGSEINQEMGWDPVHLKAKEGLALLNGTQFMGAYGVWCLHQCTRILHLTDLIGALSLDAFDGSTEPLDPLIHKIRPQAGQIKTAERILEFLKGSQLQERTKGHIQDPYSFRCMPQVHGASNHALQFVYDVFIAEINCVTDNPNIFPDEDRIISGGNFHGQPLALALDFMAIALAEIGSISERRTYQLLSGNRGLPEFLVANPGLNSGLMIPQYVAASLVSQNKQLCTPCSIDSIVSSNGQEDHVSMGANAGIKAARVVENLYHILGIELLTASQAMEFRRPLQTSLGLENLLDNFRKEVSFIDNDRVLQQDIKRSVEFLKATSLDFSL